MNKDERFTVTMLDESTQIVMADGSLKKISDCKVGDLVQGFSGPVRIEREITQSKSSM